MRQALAIVVPSLLILMTNVAAQTPPAADAAASPLRTVDARADAALKKMSDYLRGLNQFRFTSISSFDVVEPGGGLIQLSRQAVIDLQRPDKLRAQAQGDDGSRGYWYDGKRVSMLDRDQNVYSVVDAPNTIDAMLDFMSERYGLAVPTADLLVSDVYSALSADIQTGRHAGIHRVGETSCHHLVFTQEAVDWEIWIEDGDRPLPRRLLIRYKLNDGMPQFQAILTEWDVNPALDPKAFVFEPPAEAAPIDLVPVEADSQPAATPEGGK